MKPSLDQDHQMTFLGPDPVTRNDWRIRCSCGWTEKTHPINPQVVLTLRWEKHVYTPEQIRILRELEGTS